jgi:hypothetical protein
MPRINSHNGKLAEGLKSCECGRCRSFVTFNRGSWQISDAGYWVCGGILAGQQAPSSWRMGGCLAADCYRVPDSHGRHANSDPVTSAPVRRVDHSSREPYERGFGHGPARNAMSRRASAILKADSEQRGGYEGTDFRQPVPVRVPASRGFNPELSRSGPLH